MSVELGVQITISNGDSRIVNAMRIATVLPVTPPQLPYHVPGTEQADLDLIDLAKLQLSATVAAVEQEAVEQLVLLRAMIDAGMLGPDGEA